ncbi:MAG: phenylalanine--tRNA ligase subunit alpha, partial [Clostridia bacterium]|nr:phenylalanine--tRNA ligase subunit alpha [Clostridia bacterium]
MLEKINQLKQSAMASLSEVKTQKELAELKVRFLGKTGEVTNLLKGLKDVPKESRAEVGKLVNDLRQELEPAFNEVESRLAAAELLV